MTKEPLISCLCVTRNRVPLLHRAIRSFRDQSYTNKELVVVYEGDDIPTRELFANIRDDDVVPVQAPPSPALSLGELRNLAVRTSSGEYFCQWDDDDFSHPERLTFQMNVIRESGMPACVLMAWLVFDTETSQAYLSNIRPWEGSLLCERSIIGGKLRYDDLSRGEDTSLIRRLLSESLVFPVLMPQLYVYVHHGGNVWDRSHWGKIFTDGQRLSDDASGVIKDILDGKYSGEEVSRRLDELKE